MRLLARSMLQVTELGEKLLGLGVAGALVTTWLRRRECTAGVQLVGHQSDGSHDESRSVGDGRWEGGEGDLRIHPGDAIKSLHMGLERWSKL